MRVLYLFSRLNLESFDILHAFLGLTVTKLSSLKTVRFFWPTLYMPAGFSPPYFPSRYTFSLFGLCAFSVCNVALNRPSFQSSTYVYQQVSYGARLGILGTTPQHRRYQTVHASVFWVLHLSIGDIIRSTPRY